MIPLPLRDDNPASRAPVVTTVIILVNALVWVWELLYGQPGSVLGGVDAATLDYGAIPAWVLHGISQGPIYVHGIGTLTLRQEVPEPLPVLTSMFLHGSWAHIIGNMWFLWIFGDNVEDAMGRGRFVLYYLLCGVIAAMTQILSQPGSTAPMVGASGAIAGVLGGYLLLYPRARVRCLWVLIVFITTVDVPAWLLLGLWFLSQFLIPMGTGVAWMAHVGGFVAGLALIKLFARDGHGERYRARYDGR